MQNQNSLIPVEALNELQQLLSGCDDVKAVVVEDDEQLQRVSDTIALFKEKKNRIDAIRKQIKKPYDEKARLVDEFFRPAIQTISNAISILEDGYSKYIAKKEEERLKQIAMQEAEAEAERKRALEEADKMSKIAEEALAAGDTETAEKAQAQAEAALALATDIVTPVVERIPPDGAALVKPVYIAEVIDKDKATAALMANPALKCFVLIDEAGLSDFATKRGPVEIDGIKWVKEYRHRRKPKQRRGTAV